MKVVRLDVKQIKDLIEDSDLNLKVIHLIRDPRGVMMSRKIQKWCIKVKNCTDSKTLCEKLEKDLDASKILTQKFPEK